MANFGSRCLQNGWHGLIQPLRTVRKVPIRDRERVNVTDVLTWCRRIPGGFDSGDVRFGLLPQRSQQWPDHEHLADVFFSTRKLHFYKIVQNEHYVRFTHQQPSA